MDKAPPERNYDQEIAALEQEIRGWLKEGETQPPERRWALEDLATLHINTAGLKIIKQLF